MQLKEFLDRCSVDKQTIKSNSIICFSVLEESAIPVVFISQFIHYLRNQTHHIESIDVALCSYSHCISQLETSFLGMGLTYWLRGINEVDKKYRTALLEYIRKYEGPHQLILCLSEQEAALISTKKLIIPIPPSIPKAHFLSLLTFFNKKNARSMYDFIQKLYDSYEKISLDQACMVATYLQVMGRYDNATYFFEKILASEKSLFMLSQYFFAKESTAFFKLWDQFEAEYPIPFWCTFWSEQLWRAYYVRYFLENQQASQVKSVGSRLPFSYLQKDWKKTTRNELKNAHNFMYEMDVAFKNNIETQNSLMLFYLKFFLSEFNS